MRHNSDPRPAFAPQISRLIFIPALLAAGISAPIAAQTQYTIHDLGTLGGSSSQVGGINNSGQVAGSSATAGGQNHAFRTAANSPINPLTDDLGTLGGTFSFGLAINDAGQVVGDSAPADFTFSHAYRTAPQSAINPATDVLFPGGGPITLARGVDSSGQVVGTCCGLQAHQRAAFRMDANRNTSTFSSYSEAYGINDYGQVVGAYGGFGAGNQHAFRTAATGVSINPATDDLGTLGGATSIAFAVNGLGRAVGSSDTAGGQTHAFRTGSNVAINPATDDLGTLGGPFSQANAINGSGQVVGSSSNAASQVHAFLYSGGVMNDLNDLIPPNSGWVLVEAMDINDAGQVVGNGLLNGAPRAFRLDPAVAAGPPVTSATVSPGSNPNGWNNSNVAIALHAGGGDGSGVRQIQFWLSGAQKSGMQGVAGGSAAVQVQMEGSTTLTYFATSNSGRVEQPKSLVVKIDRTAPKMKGMPDGKCSLWPPNHKLVKVAGFEASDIGSGLVPASFRVIASSNEPAAAGVPDIVIASLGSNRYDVQLRAERSDNGSGRLYTIVATATDMAGNQSSVTTTCSVPHDQGH